MDDQRRRDPLGAFLTVIVNFLLLALVLFGLVKLLKSIGLGNFRSQAATGAVLQGEQAIRRQGSITAGQSG